MSMIRNLMESIDDIYEADDESMEQAPEASPAEVLKDIIGSLKELSTMIADGSIEEQGNLLSDLQNISSSLKELIGSDDDFSDEALEEEYGTEDFGPYIDKDGVQNYEVAAKEADSYPEHKGFVGM
ncbi:putative structural protein [Erwinia phage pEa_SNUABM_50]|uniref:Uncharacterized protein n=4 Tax=Eneladusvirus BF TaxID=2560751 RepID=A0A1S6UAG6_9CAUD|nr:virion structural protein [Serratia phage BF]QOI71147.1 putative structural protein [Erwinia phage pEa_SNUABM_12]QOI71691.1 putative structural protein [Erwinia phage pEa_SNUABM_47]QOI72230.1 putative structural protein [Erwinia phage pEa_SNUABM_50]QXO11356.1 hypothetical protein pEaSNUABM19_00210 [Erwinia phage pEa_SNUABM_19]QXO11904.1 hypothetical protein pEaSNUABM44_00208 [Erwinia phage pEa_SNUABM_44]QXO12456.1 hypothetical protein pEaSNUABM49_00210 [Erwinia phage pEa_SNUABM_49]